MSKNIYLQLKEKHQKEVNDFPLMFAFNNSQFDEGMKKLGLEITDTDKIYKLGNSGGYYKKDDAKKLHEMFNNHDREMKESINNDITGDGFIYDMFNYELANHEYSYTWETDDTLEALALTMEEINNNKSLLHGFKKAINYQRNND